MALSDCPKCWDTPCTCGYMGYTITRCQGIPPYEHDRQMRVLKEEIDRLREKMKQLEGEKNDSVHNNQ